MTTMLAEHMSVMLAEPNGDGVKAEDALSLSSTNGGMGSISRVCPMPASVLVAHFTRCHLVRLGMVSLVTGVSGWLCRSRYNVAERKASG